MATKEKELLPLPEQFPGRLSPRLGKSYYTAASWNRTLNLTFHSSLSRSSLSKIRTSQGIIMRILEREYKIEISSPFPLWALDTTGIYINRSKVVRAAMRTARYYSDINTSDPALIFMEMYHDKLYPPYFRWLEHATEIVTVYLGPSFFGPHMDAVLVMTKEKYRQSMQHTPEKL